MRGGSWFDSWPESRSTKRARYLPGSRASNIGFRVAA
jgi:formylglycine-generating enzyme required for sulfatase activity